jgi:hypothetical protein
MITNDIQDIKNENQAVVKAIDKNKEILSSREGSRIIALFALLNNYYQPTITTAESLNILYSHKIYQDILEESEIVYKEPDITFSNTLVTNFKDNQTFVEEIVATYIENTYTDNTLKFILYLYTLECLNFQESNPQTIVNIYSKMTRIFFPQSTISFMIAVFYKIYNQCKEIKT